jgi:oxygen-independent coproporphyrinogen-3 oxidase
MAGLYIHIPFCRQACRYCDFFFAVSLKYRDEFIEALLIELSQRKNDFRGETIETIYLGGGTPSVLTSKHLTEIMNSITKHYSVSSDPEISIEANPDDLSGEYLEMLSEKGFNRLSIGVQSFREEDLQVMRRSHTAKQASESMATAREKGFHNINMDLIYGLPGLTLKQWEENLQTALLQPIHHISAYHLTYEPGTVFHHWKKKGKIAEAPEKLSLEQYEMLRELTGSQGFEHYEISNFAIQGFRSKHNTTYWKGKNYLGFGPSAHSYNGRERQWNLSSLKGYIENSRNGSPIFETEVLSQKDKYHDYLLTSLRTIEGANFAFIETTFGKAVSMILLEKAQKFISSREMSFENGILAMTPEGWMRSDLILEEFLLSNDHIIQVQQP